MFEKLKIEFHFLIILCMLLMSIKNQAQETVFVHTDKNDYITGETIQFKAYLINLGKQKSSNNSKVIYFQLTGYEKVELSEMRANLENGTCQGQIMLPNSLKTGYYFLSAYTNTLRNYPIEACFNKKIFIANQNDKNLDTIIDFSIADEMNNLNNSVKPISQYQANCELILDKCLYKPGENINIEIKLDSLITKSGITNLSVSVAELSPFDDSTKTYNFFSYLNNKIELWKYLKDHTSINPNSISEKNGFIIKGRVLDKKSNSAINDVTVLLSTPDSVANLQYYITGADGIFYFQLNKFYDNRELFLQLKDYNTVNKDYYFEIENKTINLKPLASSFINMNALEREYLENSQKIALVNKIYIEKKQIDNYRKDTIRPLYPFYGVADEILIPADYEVMEDFDEMTRNYVWGVKLKKNSGGIKLYMMNFENKELMSKDAFCLINSIPIFSANVIKPLNTATIKKIETKARNVVYGELNLFGILSLTLDTKLASSIFSDLQIQSFQNIVMVFKNTIDGNSIATKANKIPDFRQTLYWNPEIKVDSNKEIEIEVTASSYKAKYSVIVQGLTSDNIPVFARSIFEIK